MAETAELNPESLAVSGQELAGRHELSDRVPIAVESWTQIGRTKEWLIRLRAAASDTEPHNAKAGEWLLDNSYRVQRAARQIAHDLPEDFYRRLPALAERDGPGPPRILAVAFGFLEASRLQVSLSGTVRYIRAYQELAPLTIGELWAFPTMLRLACIEILIRSCAGLFPEIEPPFTIADSAGTYEDFDDTSRIARAITALAALSSIRWTEFFDQTSLVEAVLRADPSQVYSRMDFESRDRYRKTVEELALQAARTEVEIANDAVAQASAARGATQDHVGYWLVGHGRRRFETVLGCSIPRRRLLARRLTNRRGWLYVAMLTLASAGALVPPAIYLSVAGAGTASWILGIALASVPASVLGITLVHWIVTLVTTPDVLPKLDFDDGIPLECATAVVLPIILRRQSEVAHAMSRLESHRLSNRDSSLHFVLLSDLADAPAERMPEDEPIEKALVAGIRRLNDRYGEGKKRPFHLLHRPRRYNARERCWMGRERKRGKLEEFNRFVLTGDLCCFSIIEGDQAAISELRFVVTADADTVLPPASVNRLAGTLAHPLNRARFDDDTGRVTSGYTILQPRVEITPESGNRSLFSRLFAGNTAIDIYSRAVSDVYQDLFGEGIYIGKGIYDVVAFDRSTEGLIPENALVSHDLFEGVHGRVALASDIVFYEDFPASYVEYARRWHRWVRGDWQLLPWLMPKVPGADGARLVNRLSSLSRWKILDNLRRSLIPLSLLILLSAGWLVLPGNPWIWTALAVAAPGAYLFTDLVTGLARGPRRGAMRSAFHNIADHWGRWGLAIVFLVHDSLVAVDAIVRTLWRLFKSRRRLLEWTSAAHMATALHESRPRVAAWTHMWPTPAIAALLGITIGAIRPESLAAALPLLFLWLISPEIALFVSRPRERHVERITPEDEAFLRRLARRTWFYFETFVGPADNWLPPDNFQEEPHAVIAHRTSPTNIGMMFLSMISAWDLGYVGTRELPARISNTFDTMKRLERYRGHFLNWYDTTSLAPLEPRYVSTVDSGNLAVSLITLGQACEEAARSPAMRVQLWLGLGDAVDLLTQTTADFPAFQQRMVKECVGEILDCANRARENPGSSFAMVMQILDEHIPSLLSAVAEAVPSGKQLSAEALQDFQIWIERARHHLERMRDDYLEMSPWHALLDKPPEGFEDLAGNIAELLPASTPLGEVANKCAMAGQELAEAKKLVSLESAAGQWLGDLDAAIEKGRRSQENLRAELLDTARQAEQIAFEMDFRPLYDADSRLFHIGYNISSDRIDPSHYDLLASEARLACFFAVAKGDVSFEHWFCMGRSITRISGGLTLLSWNGSMFEYLMPSLLLRSGPETLLGQSECTAVEAQMRFSRGYGIPWGISESAFADQDHDHNYRYRSFGVAELGLRRDIGDDLVISPYASALALTVNTDMAVSNLRKLAELGLLRNYGFYDAADFTPERIPPRKKFMPVRNFMAHHQGMTLAAVDNTLKDGILARRFSAHPTVDAIQMLVQERIPWEIPSELRPPQESAVSPGRSSGTVPAPGPWSPAPDAPFPQLHALGNGRMFSWISEAGGGTLRWHQHELTRWLPDATLDNWGLWVYVRDEDNGDFWSVSRQPTGVMADETDVIFHPHMAEFHRRDKGIGIRMEVAVAHPDDVEIRRISLVNESDRPRRLRLTSYGEVVLAPPADDERHPAFSKLFVGSEYLPEIDGLLFNRRPRKPEEKPPFLLHRLVADDAGIELAGFETNRERFLGRNRNCGSPAAMRDGCPGTTGWTLDAVMALDVRVELAPNDRRQFAFLTAAAPSREAVLRLASHYASPAALDWALDDAAVEASRETSNLRIQPTLLPHLQRLASLLVYRHSALRAPADRIAANRLGQHRLWAFGVSGDHPILLVRASDPERTGLMRELVAGHRFWRRKGIRVDLVVIRPGMSGYVEPLREKLLSLLDEENAHEALGRHAGIHLVLGDQISEEERLLLETCADVVLDTDSGTLAEQLEAAFSRRPQLPVFEPETSAQERPATEPIPSVENLAFPVGPGGFSDDGKEFVIKLEPGQSTPVPWCNILANDGFGAIVTEAGGGFTWAVNSGENRLTPWTNDPVADPPGEALYLRDEVTAEVWTPTPQPAGGGSAFQIRHGAGYTMWHHRSHELDQVLTIFVAPDDPVKIARLELRNLSAEPRRITATYYAEWLLGALRSQSKQHVVTGYDAACHALTARNSWNPDFSERVAFLSSDHPPHSLTTDRQVFIGREGDLSLPDGLNRWDLGGHVDPGSDPCAAFQVHLDIAPESTEQVSFVLGQGADLAQASGLAMKWQKPDQISQAWDRLNRQWDSRLSAIEVDTPDPAFDLMINRWLPYQTLSSRLMARAGFYQAGGAFGFRDQLQDVMALFLTDPARARAHILTAASRQFEEGDVLHWWHPPNDRGVRTRCSDDLLWLPYVTCSYVEATGDESILDEPVPFLVAPPLKPEEHDRYARYDSLSEPRSLLEHCERALEAGITSGVHGLPLIGTGDWNDGMDRVGPDGRGESVWLGWFAVAVMRKFASLSDRTNRDAAASLWKERADQLEKAIEANAWDGNWYLRAIDDDGIELGSANSPECRIDSIAQSWSVLARETVPARSRKALAGAVEHLVADDDHLACLLTPPFDVGPVDPGYIKGYPPGIRENGGQYSHAAAWLGFAHARLGDGDAAMRIFDCLNPLKHYENESGLARYRVEPYVVAADIASHDRHRGRGGWTWYTGAAAWTWRLGVEEILGLRLSEGKLVIDPCLPREWGSVQAIVRGPTGALRIEIDNPENIGSGGVKIAVEGKPIRGTAISFPVDGSTRKVNVSIGSKKRRKGK